MGNIYPSSGENGTIYYEKGLCPTIKAGGGIKGNGLGSCNAPKVLIDDVIPCAMRGRYNEDGKVEQQLEIHDDGISNTITTVQKDMMIIEKK